MNIFGYQITKATPQSILDRGWRTIFESFPGAWQKNVEVSPQAVLAFHAVFACMTLIASDIAKLRLKLVAQDSDGIWSETSNNAYSPILRKPNRYQTRPQFMENWMLSKLSRGNTYALKQRDNRNVVTALYVLDPSRAKPLVTPDGSVYYELQADNLAGLQGEPLIVPASEIIHDRFNCLFHPLVGVSPLYANGLAATQGLAIQNDSARLFSNGSRPGGLLIAPGRIGPENATRLKNYWDTNFTGENSGKVAVLGDGLRYEALSVNPDEAQLIEQLKWTTEVVCSTFHVPPHKVGLGPQPANNNVQSSNVEYYSRALQSHMMAIQVALNEGLEMKLGMGVHFDLDGLLLMDSMTQMEVLEKARSLLTLDERRSRISAKPITGGDTVYLQQQDHSIEAIAARDKLLIEQAEVGPVSAPTNDDEPTEAERAQQRAASMALLEKRVRERLNA